MSLYSKFKDEAEFRERFIKPLLNRLGYLHCLASSDQSKFFRPDPLRWNRSRYRAYGRLFGREKRAMPPFELTSPHLFSSCSAISSGPTRINDLAEMLLENPEEYQHSLA